MLNELDVHQQLPMSLFPFVFRKTTGALLVRIGFDRDCFQWMIASTAVSVRVTVTFLTEVVVITNTAMVTLPTEDFSVTGNALLDEFWCVPIMQMPKNHH